MDTPSDPHTRPPMPDIVSRRSGSTDPSSVEAGRPVTRVGQVLLSSVFVITVALPLVMLVALVTRCWVDVPYMDEWDVGMAITQYHEGVLGFEKLIAQHNEHRLLVPRLITIVMSSISRRDVRWEMALSMLLAAATFAALTLLPFPDPASSCRRRVVLVLISLVLFSPVQCENWLMGIQFAVFLPPWFLVVGLLVCLSRRTLWFKSAVNSVLACLATYSFGHGMVLWLLIAPRELVQALQGKEVHRRWPQLLGYVAAAAGSLLLYFYDYHPARGKPPMTHFLHHPVDSARYYLSWLGSPLVPGGSPLPAAARILVGAILLAVFAGWIGSRRGGRRDVDQSETGRTEMYPWVALGLYSMLSGVMVTIGRAGFGVEQAAETRYASFSLYLTLAAIVGGSQLLMRRRGNGHPWRHWRRGLQSCAVVMLVALHVSAIPTATRAMDVRHGCMARAKTALMLHRVVRDAALLRTLYPNVEKLLREFVKLKSHGLLNYDAVNMEDFLAACARTGREDTGNGRVDSWIVDGADHLLFQGWVRLSDTGQSGSNVILTWGGSDGQLHPFGMAAAGIPRHDLVRAFNDKRLANCGFAGVASLTSVPPPPVRIAAWTVDLNDGSVHRLATPRWLLTTR